MLTTPQYGREPTDAIRGLGGSFIVEISEVNSPQGASSLGFDLRNLSPAKCAGLGIWQFVGSLLGVDRREPTDAIRGLVRGEFGFEILDFRS